MTNTSPCIATHYFWAPVEHDGWVSLYYITKWKDGKHYMGREFEGIGGSLREGELEERLSNHEIDALDSPCPISEDQGLWLTPEGNVYCANDKDPLNDNNKTLVGKLKS